MIGLVVALFEIYKKPSEASFSLKKFNSGAILGTPRPLSLKKTRRPTKTPKKLGESLSHPDSRSDPIGGSEPSSGCENIYWDSLPDFYFILFLKAKLVPMGMTHIL